MGDSSSEFLRRATLEHLPRIEALAGRRFRDATLADEAVNFVLEQLQVNDWQRISHYQNRSSFLTFLLTVSARLLEDFSRQRFGRMRIPDWVRTQGPLWQLLFRLLCMERRTLSETLEIATDTAPGGRDRQSVESAAHAIRARYPNCGARGPTEADEAELEALPQNPDATGIRSAGAPDAQLLEDERTALLQTLGDQLLGQSNPDVSAPAQSLASLVELKAGLRLSSEERLLLKLVFADGLKVTDAGALLGYNAHQTHGRLRRLLQRLRSTFEHAGIRFDPEDFG